MYRSVAAILVLCLFGLALAACGGGESESEAEREAERSEAFAPICEMTAMSGDTGLPANFPTIGDITYVKSEQAGPSTIVEGYGEGSLEDLYNELHDAFESSEYRITFDEREDHDAEISFEGGGESGQVKFADECGEGDRVYVRVTSRPTG
jgi:hypothetical protein